MASALIRNNTWCADYTVEEFRVHCSGRGRPVSDKGVSYGELLVFVKFTNARCVYSYNQISLSVLDKSLLSGVNGFAAGPRLLCLALSCGVYICASLDSKRTPHCFMIHVDEKQSMCSTMNMMVYPSRNLRYMEYCSCVVLSCTQPGYQ